MSDTNHDFLSDLAGIPRGSGYTNNQLLELVVIQSLNGTQITKQPAINPLTEEANESDIWQKVNEIIQTLKNAGVTED